MSSLSIYDSPSPEPVLVPVVPPLQPAVNHARNSVLSALNKLKQESVGWTSQLNEYENSVAQTVTGLVKDEPNLVQGLPYVGVGTLLGSIITRNRSIGLRIALPSLLFGWTMSAFLPTTYNKLQTTTANYTKQHLPQLHNSFTNLRANIHNLTNNKN